MPAPLTPKEALGRLADMCARSERCESELRRKLAGWGIAPSDADKIMAWLAAKRFVDDARFARAYAADKLRISRWGPRKIRQGLCAKRVAPEAVAAAMAAIDPEECRQALRGILEAKARQGGDLLATYEGRTRLYRFASQRGFDLPMIAAAIKELLSRSAAEPYV